MDNGKKNTLKILTTNDIRKHSRDWTLAGDVGLLAHLEQFSENIINKTEETQANFNELVDNFEELHTKVGNITNQFLALQNCQFVENRVYDEETPTEEKTEVKVQNEEDQEKLLLMQYKEAVEVGIKLLDTHFQEVQLPPNSDSDDEDEISPGNSIIWKPKNPYASKKFPFLIGSSEWWADDNVGLRPNKESADAEKIISESESDGDSLKSAEKPMKSSSSSSSSSVEKIKSIPTKPTFMESSEDLFGFDKNEILRNTSDGLSKGSGGSVPEESAHFLPDFGKGAEMRKEGDSFEEQTEEKPSREEMPASKPKKVDNEFTRELMAKLVSVTNKTENGVEEEEKKKEKDKVGGKSKGGLFDETDDSSSLFSGATSRGVIPEKAEGKKEGLFFDAENEDDLFRGENDLFSGSSLFEGDVFKKPESQFVAGKADSGVRRETEKKEGSPPQKSLANDLFDDLDDDDDTLFAARPTVSQKPKKQPDQSLPPTKDSFKKAQKATTVDFGWDDDEGLFESGDKRLDDDLFSSSGLFDTKVNKLETKEKETKTDLPSKKAQPVINSEINMEKPTKSADVSPLFDSDLTNATETTKHDFDNPFGFSSTKDAKKISIFDSEREENGKEEDEEEEDLFSKGFTDKDKKPSAALPDDDDDDDDTVLFGGKPKPLDSVSVSSSRSSLFDDMSVSKSRLASVFERDKPTKSEEVLGSSEGKPVRDLFGARGKDEKSSLFDDVDDDDLFSVGVKKRAETEEKPRPREDTKEFEILSKGEPGKDEKKEKQKSFIDDLEDGDLFKSWATPGKLRSTKSDIFRHSEEKLFGDDPSDELFSDKSSKPKPPSSLSLKPKEGERRAAAQPVGKLNIPDTLKVKFESVAKKISPGGMNLGKKPEEEVLEEPAQPSTLLKCPSKDRVKIPGKRRPQSRRARQEAIRKSGNWDAPSSTSSSSQPAKESSPAVSNPLSPSTDEEDFFKVPELDKNFEKEDQSIFKSDLFDSSTISKLEDNLLFDGAPVLSPLSPKKPTEKDENPTPETEALFGSVKPKAVNLFDDDDLNGDDDDDDDDESLFKMSKPVKDLKSAKKTEEKSKKPLFGADMDDDEDEDDLFGGKSHVTPSKLPPVDKRKEGGGAKEKENAGFVDPLGLMTNDR